MANPDKEFSVIKIKLTCHLFRKVRYLKKFAYLHTWLSPSALGITAGSATAKRLTSSLDSSSSFAPHVHVAECCANAPWSPPSGALLNPLSISDCQAPGLFFH